MFDYSMTRRGLLGLLGAGAGAMALRPFGALASETRSADANNRLVVVFANGGIRSLDAFDGYESYSSDSMSVDIDWDYDDGIELSSTWRLPPHASPLEAFADKMAIVRHVGMETASHPTGKIIATTGKSRNDAPAGAVIVANEGVYADYMIGSLSLNHSLQAGELSGAIAAEPDTLVQILGAPDFAGNDAVDAAVWSAIESANGRAQGGLRKWSKVRDWFGEHSYGKSVIDAGLASDLTVSDSLLSDFSDGGRYDEVAAKRFAAAYLAIAGGHAPVSLVSADGFDTHSSSQVTLCSGLCFMLAQFMEKLGTLLDDTTIVVVSDFDRTPSINSSGGTDHWLYGSVALWGSGIDGVTELGDKGAYPGSDPSGYTREELWATIIEHFGVSADDYFPTAGRIAGLFS